MLKMSSESKAFLEKNLPAVLEIEDINEALIELYDWIDAFGFEAPEYEYYNDRGREAQQVYDDLFANNDYD